MTKRNDNTRDFGSIYRYIYRFPNCTRFSIINALKISRPTVLHNLQLLQQYHLIYKSSYQKSTGGRKAETFRCTADARFSIGIDITQNHLSLVLINLNLDIIDSLRLRCPFEDTEEYYDNLLHEFTVFLEKQDIDRRLILGIGVSLPAHIAVSYTHLIWAAAAPSPFFTPSSLSTAVDTPCTYPTIAISVFSSMRVRI